MRLSFLTPTTIYWFSGHRTQCDVYTERTVSIVDQYTVFIVKSACLECEGEVVVLRVKCLSKV